MPELGPSKIIGGVFLLFTVLHNIFPVGALALEKITFSWQANPPHEYVLGYRLYYGSSSRFNDNGLPIPNFSYDYYLDFNNFERCVADETGSNCEKLDFNELRCENLLNESPRCTIYNLPARYDFFAMTAYNAETESGYTYELSARELNATANRGVVQMVNLLLLKDKKLE
jgi:hypothetical protein